MKILYTSPLDPRAFPGPGDHIDSVVRAWQELGHEVTLVHPGDASRAGPEKGVDAKPLSPLRRELRLARDMVGRGRLRSTDVVYHRFTKSSLLPILLAKLLGRPVIVEVNTDLRREVAHLNSLQMRLIEWIERANYRLANHIVVVAPGIKEVIKGRYGISDTKITVVANGANLSLFRPADRRESRRLLGLDTNRRYVVFSGTFQPWQGIDVIVAAAARVVRKHRNCNFLLIGDGPILPEISECIRQMELESFVRCTGWETLDRSALYIGAADLCLAPYNRNSLVDPDTKQTYGALMKGSPLKLFSYLAAGRPVVATHFDNAGLFLEALDVGIAVEPDSCVALANAIEQLLEMDPDEWEAMSIRARAAAVNSFSWRAVATTLEEICSRIVQG
jgi:glycosyltransferase involved in cell wall biosynthesis